MAHTWWPPKKLMGSKRELCHWINALHVYCRLRDLGLSKRWALWLVRRYEGAIKALKGEEGHAD